MRIRKESGKGSLGVLIAIIIIVGIILVAVGYKPYIDDVMDIKKGLNDALSYGANNPVPDPQKYYKLFYVYCDTATLNIEFSEENLIFEKGETRWKGRYHYVNDKLKVPLLNIQLNTIEKDIEESVPFVNR